MTLRGSGDLLVGGEAPSAAIGIVEAPQQRPQHPERRPGKRPLVLAGLAIRRIEGRRRGPEAGFGVAVKTMRRHRSKDLLPARPQGTRQNKLHAGSNARVGHRPSLSAENHRLTAGCYLGKLMLLRHSVSRFDRMQGPPLGGLCCFWAIGSRYVDDNRSACRH